MSYYQKTLLTTLTLFIASETSLNAGWKDFFTMPRVALGIAAIVAGNCIGGTFFYVRKLYQKIDTLNDQLQRLKENAGSELTVCIPRERKEVGSLTHVLSLMATKEELKESFNFFTTLMKTSQQEIQTIHNELSQGVEQPSSTTQWTDDNEEPVTVIIRTGPFKKALGSLEKLATDLDPKDSLKQHAASLNPAILQQYETTEK